MTITLDEKATDAIRSWFKRNGIDCGCGFGAEFYYLKNEHKICIPKVYEVSPADKFFALHINKMGLKENVHWIVMSILHEVGHSETVKYFTARDLKQNAFDKLAIQMQINENNYEKMCYKYWELPIENIANKWAITFANTFPKKIESLTKIILRYYSENEED